MSVFDSFFQPRSVAVIGASSDPDKVGYAVLRNALYGTIEGPTDRSRGRNPQRRRRNPARELRLRGQLRPGLLSFTLQPRLPGNGRKRRCYL